MISKIYYERERERCKIKMRIILRYQYFLRLAMFSFRSYMLITLVYCALGRIVIFFFF